MAREVSLEMTRNIGIMAHIDAEKNNYYRKNPILYWKNSHKIEKFMKVLCTMDWMEQEQERGITITSAYKLVSGKT